MADSEYIKVGKSSLLKVLWSGIGVVVTVGIPYVWGWERNQTTRDDVAVMINIWDHGTVFPLPKTPTSIQEGLTEGVRKAQSDTLLLKTDIAALTAENKQLRGTLKELFEWQIRYQASSSEPNRLIRARVGQAAVNKFRSALARGEQMEEAARSALAINPYELQ